jgi:AraC-like DNA-binding protein
MPFATIDIALRSATVALLLVLAAALLRDFRTHLAGRLAIAFALGSAAHAASFGIDVSSAAAVWRAPLIAFSSGNLVVFWLFCRALFDDAFVLRRWHAVVWLAVTAFSFADCLLIAPHGHARFAVVTGNLLALGFIGMGVGQTVSSWSADLVEGRRRLRAFIVLVVALYGGLNAALQLFPAPGNAAVVVAIANAALLTAVVATIAVAIMRVTTADLFAAPGTPPAVSRPVQPLAARDADAAEQKLVGALMRLMADERIYRQDNLTIGMLATKLKIPEYRLRRLINQKLGYRNFNAFLNNHRIEEAKAALADPAQAEVPVITIAMDAGFQSLGPFNRAFKAMTGVTPSEYRRLKASAA